MDIRRQLLLISNPGLSSDKTYAPQTRDVIDRWESYFRSPIGGCWGDGEIMRLGEDCPISASRMDVLMSQLNLPEFCEYSIIVFCGHGGCTTDGFDAIQLPVPSVDTNLYPVIKLIGDDLAPEIRAQIRRTVILDACRSAIGLTYAQLFEQRMYSEICTIDGIACRDYYNELIMGVKPHIELLQSTKQGAYAYGTLDGSCYGDTVSKIIRTQSELWKIRALNDSSGHYYYSMHELHDNIAASPELKNIQEPQYNSTDLQENYPFCALHLPNTRTIYAGGQVVEIIED
jgi:hypothetical protein